ncbi:MAG: biopolymer transporter ExbD [Roseococcus sp.]|nr:biopolymer transporter ExbD [Roseococcus sp.]
MPGAGPDHGDDEGGAQPLSEINVTPFVDVMLVLLVVFMVAAPLMLSSVPVQLPSTAAAPASPPADPIVLTLDREGRSFLRDEAIAPGELAARLRQLAGGSTDRVIHVRADRALPYGDVLGLMGQVSAAGFTRVALLANPPAP